MDIYVPRFLSFVNVGEDPPHPLPGAGWVKRRHWKDCGTYNFISAGQARKYSEQLERLYKDDIITAYITGCGYVGIGKVTSKTALPIRKFLYNGVRTLYGLVDEKLFDNSEPINGQENPKSEYVVGVEWIEKVSKEKAYWKKKDGLFASRLIQCTLENQPHTIEFLKESFDVRFVR